MSKLNIRERSIISELLTALINTDAALSLHVDSEQYNSRNDVREKVNQIIRVNRAIINLVKESYSDE